MARADLVSWREYVAGEVARFYEHTGGVTYIWQHTEEAQRVCARLQTMRVHGRAATDEEAAFSGPWHIVRNHFTTEFLQWVDEYDGTKRYTYTEWVELQRAEREKVAYLESADYTLGQLEELRRLQGERDALIVEAARRGAAKTAIARSVGLSRQQVHAIVAAADAAGFAAAFEPAGETVEVELREIDGEIVEVF